MGLSIINMINSSGYSAELMNPLSRVHRFLRISPSRRIFRELMSGRWKEFTGRVLEIGPGDFSHSNLFDDYVTVDIARREGVDILADAEALPFRDSVFQNVISLAVLEHTKRPRYIVREMKRVLQESGKLLVWVPFIQPMHDLPADYFRFTREGITDILGDEDHIEIIPCGGFFSAIAYIWWGVIEYYRRKKNPLVILPIPFYLFSLLFTFLDYYDKEKRISIGYLGIQSREIK
jgi:SAM-dependent methyltransferase